MKVNNINLIRYEIYDSDTAVLIVDCSLSEAASLEGQLLVVTGDDGEELAYLGGWDITSILKEEDYYRVCFLKKLEANTKESIIALEKNQEINSKDITDIQSEVEFQNDLLEEILFITLGGSDD